MTPAELDACRERNDKRKLDPRIHYQWGCDGRTRGVHHHDDRCDPPVTVDIDALLAEVRRLTLQVEGYQLVADIKAHVAEIEEDVATVWQVQLRDRNGTPVWFEQGTGNDEVSWAPAVHRAREAALRPELEATEVFVAIDELVMVDRKEGQV